MRTLNRPMFRYGGPIKEGVMHGIREPKRHGGSMGEPQGKNLVGDPVYPKTDGRAHHFAFGGLGVGALAALSRFGPAAYRGFKAARAYKPWSQNLGAWGRAKDIMKPSAGLGIKMGARGEGAGFRLGSLMRSNPLTTLSLAPQVGALGYGAAKGTLKAIPGLTKGYIDALIPGETIFKEKDKNDGGKGNIPGLTSKSKKPGENSDMYWADPEKAAARAKEAEAKARKEKMESYREIMNIKGMKKDAVYKSLVDVSKQIQEGGSLKEQLKSGSLISNLTQAASKRFDKVADTETALRSLVAKGEIQKDMNKEDKALANELTRKRIEVAEKQLAGDTLMEKIAAYTLRKEGTPPSGTTLSSILRTDGVDVTETVDTTTVMNWIGKNKGKDEIDYMQSQVDLAAENGTKLEAGTYVIRDRIVIIDENGNVKKYH